MAIALQHRIVRIHKLNIITYVIEIYFDFIMSAAASDLNLYPLSVDSTERIGRYMKRA